MRWFSRPSIGATGITITIATGITAGMAITGITVGIATTTITGAATGTTGSR